MRYKETKGHLPFMKVKTQKVVEPFSATASPGSSGIFEAKESEKTVQAVTTIPARTVSE